MSNHPWSVTVFLPDGTADGVWEVGRKNWTGKALVAPRTRFEDLRSHRDLNGPGVYLLIGPSELELHAHRIYIGETENLSSRLSDHKRSKDFWDRAIVFTSQGGNLNKAHILYLEARLTEEAATANLAEMDNANVGSRPSLSEPDIAEAEVFLTEMLLICLVLGVQVFQKPSGQAASRSDERPSDDEQSPALTRLYLTGENTKAEGVETANGFVTFAGSLGRAKPKPSFFKFEKPAEKLRTELLNKGILIQEGNHIRLTEDHEFNSPSKAAQVMLGRSASPRDWKSAEGKTLQDLRAAESLT